MIKYTELPAWSSVPLMCLATATISDAIYRIGFNTNIFNTKTLDAKDTLADKVDREVKALDGINLETIEPPTSMGTTGRGIGYEEIKVAGHPTSVKTNIQLFNLPDLNPGLEFSSMPASEYLRQERERYAAEK